MGTLLSIMRGEMFIYEYKLQKLSTKTNENKCFLTKIYQGPEGDLETIISEKGLFGYNGEKQNEHLGLEFPIFKV